MDNFKHQQAVEKAAQLAYRYESKYYACSQTVLAALMEAFGAGDINVLRAATTFAGGVARRGSACGSLSGGLIMLGYLTGRGDLEMIEQYQRGMKYADKLCSKFEKNYGTVICKEIQKSKFGRSFDLQRLEEREKLHAVMKDNPDGCQAVARDAARWTAEIMVEIFQEGPPMARILAQPQF